MAERKETFYEALNRTIEEINQCLLDLPNQVEVPLAILNNGITEIIGEASVELDAEDNFVGGSFTMDNYFAQILDLRLDYVVNTSDLHESSGPSAYLVISKVGV